MTEQFNQSVTNEPDYRIVHSCGRVMFRIYKNYFACPVCNANWTVGMQLTKRRENNNE